MLSEVYLKINKKVEIAEKGISVFIITAIVVIVFVGTVARYIFDYPIFGAERLATYLMVWLGFMGVQITSSKMRHIEIEAVKSKMKPPVRHLMNIVSNIIGSAILVIFFKLSVDFMLESKNLDDADIVLNIPMWWIILIMPLSFGLSAIRFLFAAFFWWDVYKCKRKEEDIVKKELL